MGLAAGALVDVLPNALRAHLDILRQDLRHTVRSLSRAKGFALTAILVAALGIGATTATFSILDYALLRPLPFPQPEQLVRVWQDQTFRGYSEMEVSPPNFRDYQRMSGSFADMGAGHNVSVNLVGRGEPRRLDGEAVTFELLRLLGTAPALGRAFTAADDAPGAPGTLLLSEALWKSQFAADPAVIGQSVLLDDDPFTIIGVMPESFAYPSRQTRFWIPARFTEQTYEDRGNYWLKVVGRLKPGVTLEQARSEMRGIAAALERAYPKENARNSATVNPLSARLSRQSRLLVTALFGAALAVLLISCTNLANLLLVRAIARRRELAVRAALGAGRERLLRQLLTESLLLALVGGALGVVLAAAAAPLLARFLPASIPVTAMPAVDLRILLFAAALTMLTGIAFGVLPALARLRRRAGRDARRGRARGLGTLRRKAPLGARRGGSRRLGRSARGFGPAHPRPLEAAGRRSGLSDGKRDHPRDLAALSEVRNDRAPPAVLRPDPHGHEGPPGSRGGRVHQLPADDDARRHLVGRHCPARPRTRPAPGWRACDSPRRGSSRLWASRCARAGSSKRPTRSRPRAWRS